jgi:hypothetical protein
VNEIEFETILDKHGRDRMRVKLIINKGKLIDVVFQYEAFTSDKLNPIVMPHSEKKSQIIIKKKM